MHRSAIAYGVGHMNGACGIVAWRWLFIIEGLPSGKWSQKFYSKRMSTLI